MYVVIINYLKWSG